MTRHRECDTHVYPGARHCERSEAIQELLRGGSLDCFAALAMTEDRAYPGILTGSDSYPLMKLE